MKVVAILRLKVFLRIALVSWPWRLFRIPFIDDQMHSSCVSYMISVLFYEGHAMFKSLIGKKKKKNTMQNPKLVWRKEWRWRLLPEWAFTDEPGADPLLVWLLGRWGRHVNYCLAFLDLCNLYSPFAWSALLDAFIVVRKQACMNKDTDHCWVSGCHLHPVAVSLTHVSHPVFFEWQWRWLRTHSVEHFRLFTHFNGSLLKPL